MAEETQNPEDNKPFFSLELADSDGAFEWETRDEVVNWINDIRNSWSWLNQCGSNAGSRAWQFINPNLENPLNQINSGFNSQNQGQIEQSKNYLNGAKIALEGLFKKSPWLLLNRPVNAFIQSIRTDSGDEEASIITAALLGQDVNGNPQVRVVSALIKLELYNKGIENRCENEGKALKQLVSEIQNAQTSYKANEKQRQNKYAKLEEALDAQSTSNAKLFDDAQTERVERWDIALQDAQDRLGRLETTYNEYMALAAPVSYWESKRVKHRNWSFGTFAMVAIAMIALAIGLYLQINNLESALNVQATASTSKSSVISAELFSRSATWHFGSLVLLATLGFWFTRLLVRLFLSHIHLENDAAERVTMAKTYLALLKDDSLPTKDSLGTVLAALFRPTGDGIVKDEGLPPTAMEWLTKLSGK